MLDRDLANLYGVETKVLNQAVVRNIERFPSDFAFRLDSNESKNLKSQIVTSSWGGRRKLPLAFTEQGVAMLSSVLRSTQAVKVNIEIMRAFVRIRHILESNKELAKIVFELRSFIIKNSNKTDQEIRQIWKAIEKLTEKAGPQRERQIGFCLD